MNKVYQVIWSRVRHCYMAVAETVARSHYKHSSKSAAKATWAAVAAAGLLTGFLLAVWRRAALLLQPIR